ncbi:MAG: dipeptidase PepE [Bacteroidales bacterium]|nr:dipeptidase PepE [Bacteroidales bacterium]
MNLLLISNSTMAGEEYLLWPRPHIQNFLQENSITEVCFVPYAGISLSSEGLEASYDIYAEKVTSVFKMLGAKLVSVHTSDDPKQMIREAQAVVVGGGNTFHLVFQLQSFGLMEVIRERVKKGLPFMGWSAGSNIACPSLMTTNDMPIIEPISFKTLGLIPFQINPHYLDANPTGHGGETREQRINEFLIVNKNTKVVGLREGCLLSVKDGKLKIIGSKSLRVFEYGQEPKEIDPGQDISFLLH